MKKIKDMIKKSMLTKKTIHGFDFINFIGYLFGSSLPYQKIPYPS